MKRPQETQARPRSHQHDIETAGKCAIARLARKEHFRRAGELSLLDKARDRWIDTRLGLQLIADAGVSAFDYHVSVVGGIVYVLGIARDAAERDRVALIASGVEGVHGVVMHAIARDDPLRSAAR